MAYHVVDPDQLPVAPDRPSEMHDVAAAVGLENLGLRTYRVEPGQDVPLSGMHYHDEQEEAFYVTAGTLSVETPETTSTVETGEFFVAEPASPHRAHNPADAREDVRLIGIGAPPVDDGHAYQE